MVINLYPYGPRSVPLWLYPYGSCTLMTGYRWDTLLTLGTADHLLALYDLNK